jgi:hypothetical protein
MTSFGMKDPDPIIGEVIVALHLNKDNDELTFVSPTTVYVYSSEGDCCSQSWIEHITVPSDIVGATITGKTEPELPAHDGTLPGPHPDHEELAIYHTAWQTTRGEIIAEYRNSSNGYYGGWMTGPVTRRLK